MKKIIAVDIDDVLLPHFEDLMNWYNSEYGTHLTLADNHSITPHAWGTDDNDEAIRRVNRFFDTPQFLEAIPYDEAVMALRHLSQHYTLVVITARDDPLEAHTRSWLKKHFKDLIHDAHFTAHYSLTAASRSKADVCVEIGASYLVDDITRYILDAADKGVKGVLFGDYPWNTTSDLPPNVTRCADWPAVMEYFDAAARDRE